jgi:hypothetical protein
MWALEKISDVARSVRNLNLDICMRPLLSTRELASLRQGDSHSEPALTNALAVAVDSWQRHGQFGILLPWRMAHVAGSS